MIKGIQDSKFKVRRFFLGLFLSSFHLIILSSAARAEFTITGGTFSMVSGTVFDTTGSFVLSGGVVNASGTIRLTANWNKSSSAIFQPRTSTVTFYNVMISSLTGNTTFNVLSCNEPSKTLYFQNGSTQGILTVLSLDGQAAGTRILLRPTVSGTTWYIRLLTDQTVQFVDVQNSSAMVSNITANSSIDSGGNNSRWIFPGIPDPPFNLTQFTGNFETLSFGNWTQSQVILATFTLTDPNPADTLQYNIQFSSFSNFSFLAINSTQPASATLPQGTTHFRTSLLPQATWFWRVKANDNTGFTGTYSVASQVNGRSFGIDFTSPTGHSIQSLTAWLTSVTVNVSVVIDTVSGPNEFPHSLRYSTSTTFTAEVSTISGWFSGTSTQTWLGLTQNTTYFFQTRARDGGVTSQSTGVNISSWTGSGSVSVSTRVTLSAVPILSAFSPGDVTATSIIFNWTANNNPSGTFYEANVSTSSLFAAQTTTHTTTSGLSITTSSLQAQNTYYFRVRSRNHEQVFSSFSASVSTVTLDPAPPSQISDLTALTGDGSGKVFLSWTAPGDDGATGNITGGIYDVRYRTTQITNEADFSAATQFNTYSTNTVPGQAVGVVVTGLTPQTLYYFAVKTRDDFGNWANWSQSGSVNSANSATASGHGSITVDGSASDWNSLPASLNFNAATFSNGEWVWKDKTGEQRTEGEDPDDNYDLSAVQIFADSSNLYFLIRLKDITNVDLPYIGISIATGTTSGMSGTGVTWGPGDDSNTNLGNDYGGYQMRATRQLLVHSTACISQTQARIQVELWDGDANPASWYTLASAVSSASATNDVIEVKIARADLGLSGSKVMRAAIATFNNNWNACATNTAESTNTTKPIAPASFNPDALDSMSMMRFWHQTTDVPNRNDWNNLRNTWWEDLSDSDIDFWTQIVFDANGMVQNTAPNAPTLSAPANAVSTNTLTPTLQWSAATDPDTFDAITGYLIELGTSSTLTGNVSWRVNVQDSSTSWQVPSSLQNATTYYWRVSSRDRAGELGSAAAFSFFVSTTIAVGSGSPAFTPTIDGIKDSGWGNSPLATSPQSMEPISNNLADDLYVTNDAAYLYIGWRLKADPWTNSIQPDIAFALETGGDPLGLDYDPWRTSSTELRWANLPDFWVNCTMPDGGTTLQSCRLFEVEASANPAVLQWNTGTALTSGSDFTGNADNTWGEIRLPLKTLKLKNNQLVNLLMAVRPGSSGAPTGFTANNGYNDSTPYDRGVIPSSATSDWAHVQDGTEATFNSTASARYRIQFSTIDAKHIPNSIPVSGLGTMRNPLTPDSSENANIKISITPQDIFDTGEVRYSTGSVWGTTNTLTFGAASYSGGVEYRAASLPAFPKGTTVKYYALASANGMDTFVYGSGDSQSFVTRFATVALANAWSYTVRNGSPTAPTSVSLTPALASDSSLLYCQATGATEPDGDAVVLRFRWYRNNSLFATETLTTSISTRPASDTTSGEQWFCTVQSSDTEGLVSSISTSNAVAVLSQVWLGTAPTRVNVSTFSLNPSSTEFIWLDKTGDVSDSNADLTEVRIKFDATYANFLFKFRDITDANNPFVAITVDSNTTVGVGETFVGDDSPVTLGVEYSTGAGAATGGYQARWERQIILHSTAAAAGSFAVEISSQGSWVVPPLSLSSASAFVDADMVEARIHRNILGLSGSSARFAIATLSNNPGRAETADTTSGNAEDSLSLVRISTGSGAGQYTNDSSNSIDAQTEDLSDAELDFWFELLTDNTDTSPPVPFNPLPLSGSATNTMTPTLSWNQTLTGTGFAVTSFLLELNDTNQLDGTVKWRVNVSTNRFQIPTNLKGQTTYYWRIWARNRKGVVTPSSQTWTFFVDAEEAIANTPVDTDNLDTYGRRSGEEDADGTVSWRWAPVAVASYPITNYILEVSSTTSFDFFITSDVATLTYSTITNLSKGMNWYARLRAKNSLNITGPYSPISDGILVAARNVDGTLSDWANTFTLSSNTAIVLSSGASAWREVVWKDALRDQRKDGPDSNQLDLSTFAVTADAKNLYMYFGFASTTTAGFDGRHFIQVAVDNGSFNKNRVFQGRNVLDEDVYVSGETLWEYLLQVRSGNDEARVNDFIFQRTGAYKENLTANAFEVAVPLSELGGAEKFLNKAVKFTVIVSSRDSNGNVGQWATAISTPHAVDVVSQVSSSDPTWDEVRDSVVDFYLQVTFGGDGQVTSVTPVTVAHAPKPAEILANNEVNPSVRDMIMYNLFVDKFYDGDPTNNNPQDPPTPGSDSHSGGDFEGVIQKTDWLNKLGINTVYFSALTYFGGWGIWGYDVKDPFRVEDRFGGYYDYMRMIKHLRYHNIKATMDLVPGQAQGAAVDDHPNAYSSGPNATTNFGSNVAYVGQAEHQQLWSDNIRWWMGTGLIGFRWDNPKYWILSANGPQADRHISLRAIRNKIDKDYPSWYTYGEIPPGGDVNDNYTNYVNRIGLELHAAEDFQTTAYGGAGAGCDSSSGQARDWINGGIGASALRTKMEESDGRDGRSLLHAARYLNHDNGRWWSSVADKDANGVPVTAQSGKYVIGYAVTLGAHTEPPIMMFGDELCGVRIKSCSKPWCSGSNWCWYEGGTDPFPWGSGNCAEGSWEANQMQRMVEARAVFPALRRNPYDGGRFGFSGGNLDTDVLAYHRKATEQTIGPRILVLVNRSGSAVDVTVNVGADGVSNGTVYEDFTLSNFGETVSSRATVNGGNIGIKIDLRNYRLMVQGGYSTTTLTGVVTNLPSGQKAVVDVDGISVWTRDSDSAGNFTIPRILAPDSGSISRKVNIWAPGRGLLTITTTFASDRNTTALGNITLPDPWPPTPPAGFGGRARDRAVDLWWTPVNHPEAASYHIYWSSKSGGPYEWAGEFLQSPVYFSGAQDITGNTIPKNRKFDTFLTNGQTYYFVIRTANRDNTKSAFSNEIVLVPKKVKVRFWLDARGQSASKAYIRGNLKPLGPGLNDARLNEPALSYIEMTNNNDGTFEYTAEIDPTMYIRYRYALNTTGNMEDLGTYNEIGDDGALSWPRPIERGIPRGGANQFFEIRDEGDGTMLVVNKWADIGDESLWGSVAPAAPSGLSLSAGNQSLKLGWKKNLEPDIARYRIERSLLSPVNWSEIAVVDNKTLQIFDSGLTNNTTYQYRMRAENRFGKISAYSAAVSAYPTPSDTTAPQVPSGIQVFALSTSTIRITWDAVPDADVAGYNIYRSTTSGDASPAKLNSSLILAGASPSFDDSNLSVGVTYYYRLDAQDDATIPNTSTKSVEALAYLVVRTFRVDMGSAVPTSVSMTGQPLPFTNTVSMTQESANAPVWRVQTGQIAGKAMRYRYRAVVGTITFTEGNFSTNSGDREITISYQTNQTITNDWEETPTAPSNVRAYSDDGAVWIYWDAVSGVDVAGYKIYSSTGGVFSPVVSASPYKVSGLTNGQTYNFAVRSVDGGEIVLESANSNTVTVVPESSINVIFKGERPKDEYEKSKDEG